MNVTRGMRRVVRSPIHNYNNRSGCVLTVHVKGFYGESRTPGGQAFGGRRGGDGGPFTSLKKVHQDFYRTLNIRSLVCRIVSSCAGVLTPLPLDPLVESLFPPFKKSVCIVETTMTISSLYVVQKMCSLKGIKVRSLSVQVAPWVYKT